MAEIIAFMGQMIIVLILGAIIFALLFGIILVLMAIGKGFANGVEKAQKKHEKEGETGEKD